MLGGCFLSANGPSPDPALPSHLPRECQRLLVKAPEPPVNEGDDAIDIAAAYRGALLKANHRIGAARGCEDHQADTIDRGGK
jgi:hypothetical protein